MINSFWVGKICLKIIKSLFCYRRRRLLGPIPHRKISETELVDNVENQEV